MRHSGERMTSFFVQKLTLWKRAYLFYKVQFLYTFSIACKKEISNLKRGEYISMKINQNIIIDKKNFFLDINITYLVIKMPSFAIFSFP
jgi:hypothetical protein